jgi:hypothetical protein
VYHTAQKIEAEPEITQDYNEAVYMQKNVLGYNVF